MFIIFLANEDLERERDYFKEIIGSKFLMEGEIIEQSIVFFIAGYETTASTLAYCLYELAANPEIQSRLYVEIQAAKKESNAKSLISHQTVQSLPYLDAVLSETLRKYPPAISIINRECSVDGYCLGPEANNLSLNRGDIVLFPVYSIHHCEEYHSDPERFDPDRFYVKERRELIRPYTYLPFGAGPRNCVGMRFALKEAKLGLANIIDRFEILLDKSLDKQTGKSSQKNFQLNQHLCVVVLKTEPIYLRVKKRNTL